MQNRAVYTPLPPAWRREDMSGAPHHVRSLHPPWGAPLESPLPLPETPVPVFGKAPNTSSICPKVGSNRRTQLRERPRRSLEGVVGEEIVMSAPHMRRFGARTPVYPHPLYKGPPGLTRGPQAPSELHHSVVRSAFSGIAGSAVTIGISAIDLAPIQMSRRRAFGGRGVQTGLARPGPPPRSAHPWTPGESRRPTFFRGGPDCCGGAPAALRTS